MHSFYAAGAHAYANEYGPRFRPSRARALPFLRPLLWRLPRHAFSTLPPDPWSRHKQGRVGNLRRVLRRKGHTFPLLCLSRKSNPNRSPSMASISTSTRVLLYTRRLTLVTPLLVMLFPSTVIASVLCQLGEPQTELLTRDRVHPESINASCITPLMHKMEGTRPWSFMGEGEGSGHALTIFSKGT